jgi:predicted aspartyl protease
MFRYAIMAAAIVGADAAGAAEPCQLIRMATMDANLDGSDHLFIPAEMAGRKINLMVDTGGAWSLIKAQLADELKLERHYNQGGMDFVDASGNSMRQYVRVPGLKLGDLAFKGPTDFIVMEGYRGRLDRYGGTIGLNIIARFDVELDNEAKRINLFHPKHCPRIGAYWANEYVELPLINEIGLPETKVDIEGETVRALIDTGASRTFMDTDLARRKWGITPQTPGVVARGDLTLPSGKTVKMYDYTFKSLTISGFHFDSVEVVLTDDDLGGLTLGMSELKHLHLYFSFKEEMLYVTTASARR